MSGVTSLSMLFLLLTICPLDVAGFPEDIKVMYLLKNASTISVMDLASQKVTNLFNTPEMVSAMDYDPVNQRVYWCGMDKQCHAQDYNGSNATVLFHTDSLVTDIQVDKSSTLYYLGPQLQIWVKRYGQPAVIEKDGVGAFTVDKVNRRVIFADLQSRIRNSAEKISIPMKGRVKYMSWNPTDSLLYFTLYHEAESEIRSIDVETGEQKTIIDNTFHPGQLSAFRDVIVFCDLGPDHDCKLYAVYTNGTNLTRLAAESPNGYIRPVLFDETRLSDLATTNQSSMQDMRTVFTWTPKIGCLQMNGGTSIKVTLTPGLEDFSLLVMDPPNGCSRDLGQFRQDITIPESCVMDQKVEVAVQLTEIKDILGGRFFRHFLFSCSDLGPDGTAMELITDANPSKTQATASNTSYADGVFSLMVVTSANLHSGAELNSATNVIWSQDGVFLVLRHRLATGSQHRTLIPEECTVTSTSHPEKKTMWLAKPDMECKQEMGLMDAWTIQSQRTPEDDVTYSPLFPFDFQVGEEVTITCAVRECPYVADAGKLQGKCLEAFEKYKSCGGTFPGSSPKRREVTSLSGDGSVSLDQATSRVMSASFTLV